jgi:ribosomal protein L12E/L44/L45/RPP1/RPP2
MAHLKRIIMLVAGAAVALAAAGGVQAQAAKKGADKAEKVEKPELAAGGMYKCTDADGSVTYTNVGSVKGCKKIEGEVNSISMARPSAPGAAPAKGGAKVETGSQRVRDTDRKRILEEELAAEEKRLAELKKEFNNGEPERQGDERNYQKYLDRTERLKADVARSEANVDSLKRELGGLKN